MKPLYNYITEAVDKESMYYKGLRAYDGYPGMGATITLKMLEDKGWYVPETKPDSSIPGWKRQGLVEKILKSWGNKNRTTHKEISSGFEFDKYDDDTININKGTLYGGDDAASDMAAIIDAWITMYEEGGFSAKKRIDSKSLYKEICKELIQSFKKLPKPRTPEEIKRSRDALRAIHGAFPYLPDGIYGINP